MLRFPKSNREFKITKANDFIANQGGQKRLFPHFTNSLFGIKTNSFQIDIDILKEPFKEFAWLFVQITRQESMIDFAWYGLYFLYGTYKMDLKFDWAQNISSEISH